MLFRGVGDAAACRCGIVVVRRKNAGAGWRAGFEAALRGLADLIPRPGLLLTLFAPVRVLLALSNFWLQAKMDGVGVRLARVR